MATNAVIDVPLTLEEKLHMAQDAFRKFHTVCFWYMREDLIVTQKNLHLIVKGLRENGTRETYRIVDQLCR